MFIYVGESGYDMQQQNNITIPQSELTLNVNNEPNIWVKLGVCADTGETLTYYQDFDGDGLGSGISAQYCSGYEPDGWVTNSDDENDFCYSNVVDCNDDCDGTAVQDCLGICGGSATEDECGECEGNGIADGACDCDGNVLDECGECGGDGIDECGICGGPGAVYCGGGIYECNEDDCPDTINYCLDLHEGANLISFYALPDDVSISHVMSSVEGNATGVIGEGVAANWNGTDWQGSINTISSLSGYWVIVSEACLLCIEDGTPTDPVIQYSLHSGANLISFPVEGSVEISFSLPDDIEGFVSGIIGEGVAANNQPPWEGSLSNLSGGNGYWMITTENISFSFNVCGVEDADGNCYETIQIGEQVWMAENLKVTHYRDGSEIPNVTNNGDWGNLSIGAYCDYDNNPSNSETYGRLYNWYTVDDDRGVCPEGFHVPSDEEYTVLTDFLGGENVAGGKMKETGLGHWNSPNTGATNESGFTGLPAGYRSYSNGNYVSMGSSGYFWSSSEASSLYAWYRRLYYANSYVTRLSGSKRFGFSIRCLGD